MHASLPSTMPKRQMLRDMRRLPKHARLPSARPKEAANKGSEKASEACENTKGKAREAEACETTKDKASEAADKGARRPQLWTHFSG